MGTIFDFIINMIEFIIMDSKIYKQENKVKLKFFNLNGQEVPHLLGGGMNCPSAARLTFSLTI